MPLTKEMRRQIFAGAEAMLAKARELPLPLTSVEETGVMMANSICLYEATLRALEARAEGAASSVPAATAPDCGCTAYCVPDFRHLNPNCRRAKEGQPFEGPRVSVVPTPVISVSRSGDVVVSPDATDADFFLAITLLAKHRLRSMQLTPEMVAAEQTIRVTQRFTTGESKT